MTFVPKIFLSGCRNFLTDDICQILVLHVLGNMVTLSSTGYFCVFGSWD